MPLTPGSGKKTKEKNFDEFRHGKTYARTRAKYGAATANKQMVAVVLKEARKSKPGKSTNKKGK